jgi:hypothetical protein
MTDTTAKAEAYVECRHDVLAAYPGAREVSKGLSYVAIMIRTRDGIRLQDHLLGSGDTADRAWADAYGNLS